MARLGHTGECRTSECYWLKVKRIMGKHGFIGSVSMRTSALLAVGAAMPSAVSMNPHKMKP